MVPEPELDDDTQRLELHLAAADHVALPAIEVVSIDQDWVEATRDAPINAVDLLPQFVQPRRRLFAKIGKKIIIDLFGHRRLRLDKPFLLGIADPLLQGSIEIRIEGTIHDLAQGIRPQCGEGIDFSLLDTKCRSPFVRALLRLLQWCGGQSEIANLFNRQRHLHHFEAQTRKQKIAKRLQFARDRDRHLVSGWITVGDCKDDQWSAIFGCVFRHSVEKRVADLAAGQVKVGLVLIRQWQQHIFE